MLKEISIQNYILIDQIRLEFEEGYSAITGETGSGKSILLGAMSLVLGGRFEKQSIRNPEKKCVVEVHFEMNEVLSAFFAEHELDFEKETIIRREISPTGKSRAFINDTPVSLSVVKSLGEQLVDIHSQHQNSLLSEKEFQFSILDAFSENKKEVLNYQHAFSSFQTITQEARALNEKSEKLKSDLDYFRFQLNELKEARVDMLDQAQLEEELNSLENAEEITQSIQAAQYILDEQSEAVLPNIQLVAKKFGAIAPYQEKYKTLHARVQAVSIELSDILSEIQHLGGPGERDPERTIEIQKQLDQLYRLENKHRLKGVEALRDLLTDLETRVAEAENVDEDLALLNEKYLAAKNTMKLAAEQLTALRLKGIPKLCDTVETYFQQAGLEHAKLTVELRPDEHANTWGMDHIDLLFAANKGQALLPIAKVASGGEIARVMLAVKAAISLKKYLPTLILDEIDTGISGEIARRVGNIMRDMGERTQLLTVTHLPQVAGKATHHYKVYKEIEGDQTHTRIARLDQAARIAEISSMILGEDKSSDGAHAEQLALTLMS